MAKENDSEYTIGDWISHPYHGVGKVTDIEQKEIAGTNARYYRVETSDRTFWVPVKEVDESRSRPVVSEDQLEESLEILQEEPEEMASHYRTRRSTIQEIMERGSLRGIARMVRDLAARRREGSINTTERRAYRKFRQSLIDEWSKVEGIPPEETSKKLRKLLRLSSKKEKEEES